MTLTIPNQTTHFDIPDPVLDAWDMPATMGIIEFAREEIRFDPQIDPHPRYHLDCGPYQQAVLEDMQDPGINQITMEWGTQLGKSTIFVITITWAVTNQPKPTMMVFPSEKTRNRFVERLTGVINHTPRLLRELDGINAITNEKISFRRMPIWLALASSLGDLSQVSCGYVYRDETDKFADTTGKEGNAIDLSSARLRWHRGHGEKEINASSPSVQDGHIHRLYRRSDQKVWLVPCTNCNARNRWIADNIHWPKRPKDHNHAQWAARIAATNSDLPIWYTCPTCGHLHKNESLDQNAMNAAGKWKPTALHSGHSGYQLPSFASTLPDCTWRSFAVKWLNATHEHLTSGSDSLLQTVTNSEKAEIYAVKRTIVEENVIVSHKIAVPKTVVPTWATYLTCGVDVQDDRLYYVVRAHNRLGRTHTVDHGIIPGDWEAASPVLYQSTKDPYQREDGALAYIEKVCIDSGDGDITTQVYSFCLAKGIKKYIPIKGASHDIPAYFQLGILRPKGEQSRHAPPPRRDLHILDSHRLKSLYALALNKPLDHPAVATFHTDIDTDPDFQRQLVSEEKTNEGKRSVWSLRAGYKANHYLAANTYATAGVIISGHLLPTTIRPRIVYQNQPNGRLPQVPPHPLPTHQTPR